MAAGLLTKGPPVEPKWVFIIRIVIIFLSLLVLALGAWSMHVHVTPYDKIVGASSTTTGCRSSLCRRSLEARQYGYSLYYTSVTAAPSMMIFSAIWSLLTFGVTLGVEKAAPQAFFRICVFIAYILAAIFMLSGWAYMASAAAAYAPLADLYRQARVTGPVDSYLTQLVASTAACAGIGAVLWVLIIIATVMFAINSLRTEGAPMSGSGGTEMHAVAAQPHKGGEVAVETHPAPAPVYQQQQVYPQQPGYVQPQQQVYPQQAQQPQQTYTQ
ncbi:hypothetical protein MAPG_04154 [Magnaporthiopsis poae ATCC 64411]|uniref:MARVEL domain-containing protein n=1 Tax=Magnaporthiopsis poae (strain ATCC 64411 / 73-15) TaxID=644358 RepID=A0A0C4DVY6_MAGP6|nr:hypothetical protein MAPG_04154 [Magnaporthiopsis poae ATCC 64411]